ncbi:single-stranded DNA-binding protein [Arthrobacter liuii]|uniref:Single-stranded DNA-binding protein n=1 Tax=Arthrobacter liuii TaxID=1476996 RepID=A0ABQ2AMB1_9MICC|nr:single-stranded DNA-binding protein [Arthrobacter liuii]GGH93913.1 single-stranded DNA-binding protein [Arthrobacter liuii]
MSQETTLTIRGRLTADGELRFTPSGSGVANFTVASQASKFDKNTNQWVDQLTKFWRCAAWNQGKLTRAENIVNLLKKGDNVIVYGEITIREYVDKEGNKKTAEEIRVESIGKDLTFHGQAYAANDAPSSGYSQPRGGDPWAEPANTGWSNDPTAPPF